MSWFEKNKQNISAYVKGIIAFLCLFGMLVASTFFYDFTYVNMPVLAFILALVPIVLISNLVYDSSIGESKLKKKSDELAKKMIASSERLFIEVYNNSPVAYAVVSDEGHIVSANIAATRLFGLPTEKLVGRDFFSLVETASEDRQSVLKQKFTHGIAVSDEDVKIIRNSGIAWTKFSLYRFSGLDGRKLSLVTLVDITKQKEIDTAKSEFVSLASHQLRTPISGMRWSTELLLMDGVDSLTSQQKRYIDRLLSSIQRMSSLVDDFLQVSRFELGTRILKLEDVAIYDLCDNILQEQTEAIIGKRLKITKDYDPDLGIVNTDLGLLRMIITNLTTNAIKYSKVGGEVTISIERLEEELEFKVRDTGMGIPEAEQPRIFSKIFRASNAVREVPDGTGLGLYIAKKAVEQLQGRITFDSSENDGTTFIVVVPV